MDTETQVADQLTYSSNAMLMLNSSCQGIIDTALVPSSSGWYVELSNELTIAQSLASNWKENGIGYYDEYVLGPIIACSQTFEDQHDACLVYFDALINGEGADKDALIANLTQVKASVDALNSGVENYKDRLTSWGDQMMDVHQDMQATIQQIQNQEASLQAEISSINTTISSLESQIKTDKEAIAKAKSQKNTGITETIFGVLFAPVTGGASLILAGIGVSSITAAESKVSGMQASIANYQSKIVADQLALTNDQKQVVTLGGLTLSTQGAINDMDLIDASLDTLKTEWAGYSSSLSSIIAKIESASSADEYIVGKAWFTAAYSQWEAINETTSALEDGSISTQTVQV